MEGPSVERPVIVMVASGTAPAALVVQADAELGRRIAAGGEVHEINDERMSRDHAVVAWDRGVWSIRDLDSRNGTFVDGERVLGEARRRGDAIVRLGHTVFVLLADGRGHPAPDGDPVIGPELARACDQIRSHARGDTLLLHGEPGSGKELAARLFHASGPRAGGPFVAVSCAAIPEGVAERLIFGARRGGGGIDGIASIGHVQMATGGTLFLDDVADLDAAAQGKLLRLLETAPLPLGVVAAGHLELRGAVTERRFRDDLYRLLARTTVHLPPLRARRVDLARLVQLEARAAGLAAHAKLVEACCIRPWPGNVRELRAAVRAAATAARAAGRDAIRADDLPAGAGMPVGDSAVETAVERKPAAAPGELDRDAVIAALARANGVLSVAARSLGLHRTQLYRLLEQHGIAHDDG